VHHWDLKERHYLRRVHAFMRADEEKRMTANTHFLATDKAPPGKAERIPFAERPACSIDDAVAASGLSRSMIYNKMKTGEIEWTKIGARRLIKVPSLLRLLGVA
jgi:hypothetical protein